MHGRHEKPARREKNQMSRFASIAHTAWNRSQAAAVLVLCTAASMALPLTLASIGFHTL